MDAKSVLFLPLYVLNGGLATILVCYTGTNEIIICIYTFSYEQGSTAVDIIFHSDLVGICISAVWKLVHTNADPPPGHVFPVNWQHHLWRLSLNRDGQRG